MDKYIQYLNLLFNKETDFSKLSINDIVYESYKYNTEMSRIISKYSSLLKNDTNIDVSDEDCNTIFNNMDEKDCLLIKLCEHYLIANSKTYQKENSLVNLINEYIDFYFKNIIFTDYPFICDLDIIIRWCNSVFPNDINNILNNIYSKIEKGDISNISYLFTATWFLKIYKNKINRNIVSNIYEKFSNIKEVNNNYYLYYLSYLNFLNYFENNKYKTKSIKKNIVDFVLKNLNLFTNIQVWMEFQIIRNYMDNLKCYSDKEYHIIDSRLEQANKDMLSNLHSYTFDFSEERKKKIYNAIAEISSLLIDMNSSEQVNFLMINTPPISKSKIINSIEEKKNNKSIFTRVTKKLFLDYDGRLINFHNLTPEQEFSLEGINIFNIDINIYYSILYSTFIRHFKADNNFSIYIDKILENNKLVSKDRVNLLKEQFIKFFNADYEHSVFDIVLELEESLRYFF
ncbi:MAG: hypothetical protein ACTTID_04090 [Bacillales bacterium]